MLVSGRLDGLDLAKLEDFFPEALSLYGGHTYLGSGDFGEESLFGAGEMMDS